MLTKKFNIIRFRFGPAFEDAIPLTLSGEWVISAGLSPNINAARVRVEDYALLNMATYPAGRVGTVEFYWSLPAESGNTPDVSLSGIWLVGDQVAVIGRRPGDAFNAPQVIECYFADHRHAFVEPRGGRVNQGVLNPNPPPQGYVQKTNAELIALCMAAMGVPSAVPGSVNAVSPAQDVNWLGDHAPTELARLLEHTGHVYCPSSTGLGYVSEPGFGSLPAVPAERLSQLVTRSQVDRRPLECVITSAPTAVIRTFNGAGSGAPAWQYVAQDHSDSMNWKPLDQITALTSGVSSVISGFRSELKNVSDEWREHYKSQVYRAVRIDTNLFDVRSCPILQKVYFPDGTVNELQASLTIATKEAGGWVNRPRSVKVRQVIPQAGVIVFEDYLGSVDVGGSGAAALLHRYFTELPAASIRPTFSIEAWDQVNAEKLFATYGFSTSGGVVTPMSESAARARLKGYHPAAGIYHVPAMRFVWLNDATNNSAALQSTAATFATRLLQASALPPKEMEIAGFYPIEVGGRVTQVRYNQADARTVLLLDAWNAPSIDFGSGGDDTDVSPDASRPTKQKSRRSATARTIGRDQGRRDGGSGGSGGAGPSHQPTATSPTQSGWQMMMATPTAAVAGQRGRYLAKSLTGKVNSAATGNLAVADVGAQSPADDVALWNLGESLGTGAALSLNVPIVAFAGPQDAAGKTIAIAGNSAGGIQAIRLNTTAGFIQTSFRSNPTESDWANAIPVNSCPAPAARSNLSVIADEATGRTEGGTESDMTYGAPNCPTTEIEGPVTDFAGSGAVLIFTAGAAGAAVWSIAFVAKQSTSHNAIRLFRQPGGAGDKFYIAQVTVPALEVRGLAEPWSGTWFAPDQTNGLLLGNGEMLYAAPVEAQKFNASVNGVNIA